ncbi:MAG: DUF4815 domain-containing protein [Candidatus Pacebacteria bacterium]|nr:DUF4815 domain-containing protein [Candidatus Paceibacterota bacterium]
MPLSTNFNVTPYYDDYDESKEYYRILFRPGYAVQAREVTQLQTVLQKQIERYGQHMFKDGSRVVGGEITLDTEVKSLKLETQQDAVNINTAAFSGTTVIGGTSNARGKVVASQAATSTTQPTLMIHYLSADAFEDGETITIEGAATQATTVSEAGASGLTPAVANGSVVSIDSGVFFVGGFFCFNNANTIVFEAYSKVPTGRVGLTITESTKTSDDDSTLLDPASGAYNYAAPGSNRYKINLALTTKATTSSDPVTALASENFIQLLKVQAGKKQEEIKYPTYGELGKTLARRTYDESGDYTITPFNLDLKAHRGISGKTANAGVAGTTVHGNNTLFLTEVDVGDYISLGSNVTTAQITAIANNTRLTIQTNLDTQVEAAKIYNESEISAGMDVGKAYVKGFEYESIATQYLDVDKGRDTESTTNYSISTELGNYLVVDTVKSLIDIGASEVVHLHSVPYASINTTTNTTYQTTQVGTARIRSMDWDASSGNTANPDTNHSNYRVYLWDVNTSNNNTGTVGYNEANTRIVQLNADSTSYVNDAYTGASITVNTTSGIDVTSDVRIIDDYYSVVNNLSNEDDTGDIFLLEDDTGVAGDKILLSDSGNFVVANSVLTQATLANTTYEIDYKIKDVENLSVTTLTGTVNINSYADIADAGKFNTSTSGNTLLRNTDLNTLVYPLPQSPVKETSATGNTISYTFKKVEKSLSSDSSGKLTITLSNPNYRFMPAAGTLSATNARENFIVIVKTDNSAQTLVNAVASAVTGGSTGTNSSYRVVQTGDYLDLGAVNDAGTKIRPVTISSSDPTRTSVDIYCNTSAAIVADVIYTVESSSVKKEPGPRTKSLVAGNTTHIVTYDGTVPQTTVASGQFYFATPNQTQTGTDTLTVSDAFNLVKVVDSGQPFIEVSNTMMTSTTNDITSNYTFITGQKDNFYDHGSIKLKPGRAGPKGKIMVVVDHFQWDGGEGYHSVDSYPTAGSYNGGSNTFSYSVIPEFTSPSSGETFSLRDCIDLRPRRENESNDLSANTTAIEGIPTPDPDGSITASFSYYLSRVDKMTLTKDRKFKILKGEPALNPIAPPDDEDSMTLYVLNIPAYTFALADITTRYIDNKRFTMRDIGKLEKRIERLEYYTSLTILEKETAARDFTTGTATDSLFNPRGAAFKSGMLVDSFSGHSVGDVMNDDYNISIEYATKEMRPGFYYDNHRFTYSLGYSNNVTKTGDLITLPYTDTNYVQQPLSSNTVAINPFNIINFVGKLKTYPSSDTWFSQGKRPDITTNLEGQNDNWTLSPDGGRTGFGSEYDDWGTNWTGKQVTESPEKSVEKVGKTAKANRSTAEMGTSKSRGGISANTAPESVMKTVGNKVIDTTVVPYVRNQTVQFAATGLQPQTNVYVWFGETDVSANVRPATKLSLIATNGTFQVGETLKDGANNWGTILLTSNTTSNTATVYISNLTGNISSTDSAQYGSANALPVGQREIFPTSANIGDATHVFTVANTVSGVTSEATANVSVVSHFELGTTNGIMKTDATGQCAGELFIDDGIWRSGDKLLRITDSALNNVEATVTVAETNYPVKGLLQTREQLLISTREAQNLRELPNDEAIVTDTVARSTEKTNWINPLCQTFHVDPSTFPKGLFLRNVTLYFSAKDTYLPVTLQIRPIVNGFPSASKIVPFSEVILNPDEIQVSTTANSASSNTTTSTVFTFESPVYLTPDEYAIVVSTNSTTYALHIAEEGINSSGTTSKISKPTFVGSFYKPQNAGLWEKHPDKYLMFNAQRADFTIGAGGNTNFVKFVSAANSAVGNTANVLADKIKIGTSTVEFSDTNIQWKYAASNGTFALADGTEGSAQYVVFSPDQNYELVDQKRIVYSTNGTFRIRAEMTSANSHVSPVIDLDRMNVISVENLVDDGGLSNSDISITTRGSGYANVMSSAYTATLTSGGTTNTATLNVHVEMTMNVNSNSTTISSANAGYTVDGATKPGAFKVGEAVMASTDDDNLVGATNGVSGIVGIVSAVTYLEGNTSKNVSSVTIKTNANNSTTSSNTADTTSGFTNGVLIWANPNAQINATSGFQSGGAYEGTSSNTKMTVLIANGSVSNVVVVDTGSGYTQNPTVTMATVSGTGSINAAVQCTGEERNSGGPINAKYISRRVTLKDGFDASDLKIILNAYKPLGTDVHVYYKVKNADDPEDFDLKNYILMSQETSSGRISKGKDDIQEFIYKTSSETTAYTSNSIRYETFKTFAVKIALVANTTYDMPRVRDMRAIALD